jgi:hypothetical protein
MEFPPCAFVRYSGEIRPHQQGLGPSWVRGTVITEVTQIRDGEKIKDN